MGTRLVGILIMIMAWMPLRDIQAQTRIAIPTVDTPRIVLHSANHLVQIKWYQYGSPKLVIVMKLTRSHHYTSYCTHVDWSAYLRHADGYKYCFDIFRQWISNGYITVQDNHYERGDRYYILEYRYTSHNAPYGPFIPR